MTTTPTDTPLPFTTPDNPLTISVTPDPNKPRTCRPAMLLAELMMAGKLENFFTAAAEALRLATLDGLGSCHGTSLALMTDLEGAGLAKGWYWATGNTRHFASGGTREHSWLEVDGWALDFTGDTLLFTKRAWYRRFNHAKNVKLRDARATAQWLQKRARGAAAAPGEKA